jgi:hypothetical protein
MVAMARVRPCKRNARPIEPRVESHSADLHNAIRDAEGLTVTADTQSRHSLSAHRLRDRCPCSAAPFTSLNPGRRRQAGAGIVPETHLSRMSRLRLNGSSALEGGHSSASVRIPALASDGSNATALVHPAAAPSPGRFGRAARAWQFCWRTSATAPTVVGPGAPLRKRRRFAHSQSTLSPRDGIVLAGFNGASSCYTHAKPRSAGDMRRRRVVCVA